jgi:hypothetical protein
MTAKKQPASLAELEATVALMRKLGVTEWGDIKLGVLPPAPPKDHFTPEELSDRKRADNQRKDREAVRRRDIRFAHSSIKPVLEKK